MEPDKRDLPLGLRHSQPHPPGLQRQRDLQLHFWVRVEQLDRDVRPRLQHDQQHRGGLQHGQQDLLLPAALRLGQQFRELRDQLRSRQPLDGRQHEPQQLRLRRSLQIQ